MTNLFYLSVIVCCALTIPGNEIRGKVAAVIDGNTLEVISDDKERYQVVLLGIDCPELGQPYGEEAASLLRKTLLGQEVIVELYGKDRSKNYIGVVLSKDRTDVRLELLDRGLAWTTERDPIVELESRRLKAVQNHRGLWAGPAPTPPWIYRRQQSMLEPKSR